MKKQFSTPVCCIIELSTEDIMSIKYSAGVAGWSGEEGVAVYDADYWFGTENQG